MELAKKKALSADLEDKTCLDFTGYQINLIPTGYSLIFCCNTGCLNPTNVNTYAFNNVNITINLGLGVYTFPPLMNNPSFISDTIRLKNSVINKCVTISISPIGIIVLNETLFGC